MLFRLIVIVVAAGAVGAAVFTMLDENKASAPGSETSAPTGPTAPFGSGPIPPGLHDFAVFNPHLSLVFGDGWSATLPPVDDNIVLEGPAFLAISRPSKVVDPDTGESVPLPDNLIAWVGTHKNLDAGDPAATTLGGKPAFVIDATALEGTKTLAFNAVDAILVAKGDKMRLIVANVDGTAVTALMIASTAEFDRAVAAGQALLDTLRFEASG